MNRGRTGLTLMTVGALFLLGCGGGGGGQGNNNSIIPNPPSQEQIDRATDRIEVAVATAEHVRAALEMLGILPVYECDQPRSTFVGDAVNQFRLDHSCATVSATSLGADADAVFFFFPSPGCDVDGHTLTGDATVVYAGSTDAMEVTADLTALEVDGRPVQLEVGYGTCGDEDRVWATGEGTVYGHPDYTYTVDMTVALQAGIPVFGSDTLILNGTATLTSPRGTDTVTFEDLQFDVGDYLPKAGTVRIQTAEGTTITARFSTSFLYGEVQLTIDDYDPVRVPIPG